MLTLLLLPFIGRIQTDVIQEQIETLQSSFDQSEGDSGFKFTLRDITYTQNDVWFQNCRKFYNLCNLPLQ